MTTEKTKELSLKSALSKKTEVTIEKRIERLEKQSKRVEADMSKIKKTCEWKSLIDNKSHARHCEELDTITNLNIESRIIMTAPTTPPESEEERKIVSHFFVRMEKTVPEMVTGCL